MTLQDILDAAKDESHERELRLPLAKVRHKAEKMGPGRGFERALRARPFSVIAEIKRASPSMGDIPDVSIVQALKIYHEHPVVSAISVLTQEHFFGARSTDLESVRSITQVRPKPILRKDFIFSEYEVYYSRYLGADAILLMTNVVTNPTEFRHYHDLARSLGMDVLCEIHEEHEIALIPENARVCGINARRFSGVRDLSKSIGDRLKDGLSRGPKSDTKTDISVFDLCNQLPVNSVKIAESGMTVRNIGGILKSNPFDAALIGTSLLKAGSEIRAHLDQIQGSAQEAIIARARNSVGEISLAR